MTIPFPRQCCHLRLACLQRNGDCCADYAAECQCSCPVGEYRADGTCLLVTEKTLDFTGLCKACTAPLGGDSYYSSAGGLADSCAVTECKKCDVGEFRAGCGGGSMGECVSCPRAPEGFFYVEPESVFDCTLAACAAHHCAAGTFLAECATTSFVCEACPGPPDADELLFYFTTGATDAAVRSSSYAGTPADMLATTAAAAAAAAATVVVATTASAATTATSSAAGGDGDDAVPFNATCEFTRCADAEATRCEAGQYLSGCGPWPLNLTTNSTTGESAASSTSAACFGDLSVAGVCYSYVSTKATMAAAEAYCASLGGHVAFSNDDRVLAVLSGLTGNKATWWLGAVAGHGCSWQLLDKSSDEQLLDSGSGGGRGRDAADGNWNPNNQYTPDVDVDVVVARRLSHRGRRLGSEPDNCTECDGTFDSEFECCLEVYGQTDLYGLWNDISCTEQKQCVSSQQHCVPCLLAWCAVRNANNRNRQ